MADHPDTGLGKKVGLSDKNTLYCSFCGLSQHEVKRLVAGPTVFICNECIELCDNITWSCNYEDGNRQAVIAKIRAPNTEIEKILMNSMVDAIAEAHPELDIKFHEIVTRRDGDSEESKNGPFTFAVVSIGDATSLNAGKAENSIKSAINQLNVMTKKYINANARAQSLNEEIKALKLEYFDYIRTQNIRVGEVKDLRVVMFLDIVGFSRFSKEKVADTLDFVRSIANPIVRDSGGCHINMWGDAIVATFEEANIAVRTAIRVMKFLAVDGLDARVGMSWGLVRSKDNPALGRPDIDGETVNEAARIEPLADTGEILVTEDFRELCQENREFELVPKKVELKKPFAEKKAGDKLELLRVRILSNH